MREQHLDHLEPRGELRGDEGQKLRQALARFPRDADRGVRADGGNSAHLMVEEVDQGQNDDRESVDMPTVLHN